LKTVYNVRMNIRVMVYYTRLLELSAYFAIYKIPTGQGGGGEILLKTVFDDWTDIRMDESIIYVV